MSAFPFLRSLSGGSDSFCCCECLSPRDGRSLCVVFLLDFFVIVGRGLEVVEFASGVLLRHCAFAGLQTGFSVLW